MKQSLRRFYMECILPEIVDSRVMRNMPIREPQYILDARERAQQKKENQEKKKCDTGNKVVNRKRKIENVLVIEEDSVVASISETDAAITPTEMEVLNTLLQDISVDEVVQNIISPRNMLTDTAIELFLQIVQENTDFQSHPVLYFAYQHFLEPSMTKKDLQIIGGNAFKHWCCLHFDGVQLFIYDSLVRSEFEMLHKEEKEYIGKRYPNVASNDVILQPVTKQPDHFSCGVYAAAFATTVAMGQNPSVVSYSRNVKKMRQHLASIISKRKLVPFPTD